MEKTVADRIKELRISLELSQEELAERAGYSDKSAISKLEHAGNEITTKQLRRVAKAMGVSVAYLMGWSEENTLAPEEKERVFNQDLSPKEHRIINDYRNLSNKDREMIDRMLAYAIKMKGGDPNGQS